MAARRSGAPVTQSALSAQFQALGPLGVIVSCLQPHAREFLKQAVAMTSVAAIAKRDQPLMFRVIEKAFAEIEVAGQEGDNEQASEAWLRQQIEGLDSGRA